MTKNPPAKKQWQKPQLWLLDSGYIESKTNHNVYENTLQPTVLTPFSSTPVRYNISHGRFIHVGNTANYLS